MKGIQPAHGYGAHRRLAGEFGPTFIDVIATAIAVSKPYNGGRQLGEARKAIFAAVLGCLSLSQLERRPCAFSASRFTDRSKVPLLAGIADLQHSGAIVLGAAVTPIPMPEFGTQSIELSIDGAVVAVTPGNATTSNMLTALAWLANHTAGRGLPLKTGDVVITGSRIGPLPVVGHKVEAAAQGLGSLTASFR